jgi:dihydrofolate reductase
LVDKKLKRIIIAAVSQNGVIGNKNKIPWHSKEELIHFKKTTLGSPILMGRRTFESVGKKLLGRLNIIISTKSRVIANKVNLLSFNSVRKVYQFLRKNNYQKVFICGGSRVYNNAIKHADEMIISHMNFEARGDSKFPKINLKLWKIIDEKLYKEFIVKHYVRRKMSD